MFKKKRKNVFKNKQYRLNRADNYQNPLKLKKVLLNFKVFRVVNIILILVILAGLYFFIFSGFYHITNIEVQGNEMIGTDDILDIVSDYLDDDKLAILKTKNIFIFSKVDLIKKINKVVVLDDILIEKILPNTIRLNINEKNAVFRFFTKEQEYLVDDQGLVVKRIYKFSTPVIFSLVENVNTTNHNIDNLIYLENVAREDVNLGNQILNPEDASFILNLIEKSKEKDYLEMKAVRLPNIYPQFLIYQISSGPEIFFNLNDDLDKQLERLDILIRDKIKKENLRGLEYIDLKLGESIYYK